MFWFALFSIQKREKVLQPRRPQVNFQWKENPFPFLLLLYIINQNRQVNKTISYFPFYMIIRRGSIPTIIFYTIMMMMTSVHVPVLPRAPPDSDKELRCVAEGESVTS